MSKKHITAEQKSKMIDFLKDHPQMYMGKFTPTYTHTHSKALWTELTNELNSLPNGANKDWAQWRKTWVDIKKNSKARLAKKKIYESGTGGGPPPPPPPKDEQTDDEKIIELITPVCVTGNDDIPDPFIVLDEEMPYNLDREYWTNLETDVETATAEFDNENVAQPKTFPESNAPTTSQKLILGTLNPASSKPTSCNNSVALNLNTLTTIKRGPLVADAQTKTLATPATPTSAQPRAAAASSTSAKRVTKTMRLTESIRNNKRFLQLTEEGMKDTNNYRIEKLKILKSYYEQKKNNENRQIEVLENISNCINNISEYMNELI